MALRLAGLALLIALVFSVLVFVAEGVRNDPTHENRVPHPEGTMLTVTFAHADHVKQSCINCHHNYVDATGFGMCLDCHKTDETVKDLIEEQFHGLCRDCHLTEQTLAKDHGPTRSCIACHVPDEQP